MNLQGLKIAILVEQQYQELEIWYPHYRLKEAGATSVLVGPGLANRTQANWVTLP